MNTTITIEIHQTGPMHYDLTCRCGWVASCSAAYLGNALTSHIFACGVLDGS